MVKKAGMAVAQKSLRHSDVRLTIHTYGHLEAEDVREGLGKAFSGTGSEARTAPGLQNREGRRRKARRRPLWNCGNCVPSPRCVRGISGARF